MVYLLISGYCEYDAHESVVAVCPSVDAAKTRAQRWANERADLLDALPHRRGISAPRTALRWGDEHDGSWTELGYDLALRIETWDVEEG